jgi:hypothetical protein
MGLVSRTHDSGLLLVEQSQEEAALRRDLKRLDDRLRLLQPAHVCPGTPTGYWRVVRVVSDDRPAAPVLTWMDALGEPLPLTSGILDEVNRHRKDGRNFGPNADERNAALEDAVRREREQTREAIHDEYAPYLERERVGVSLGAHNRIPYWQRKYRGGEA